MSFFENLLSAIRANFLWAIGVNVPIALVSYAAGIVRGSGLVAGLAYGLVIYLFGGYGAFVILLFFFLAGSIATKIGVAHRTATGAVKDTKGARRGAGSVVGKCTVGAVLAALIGASGGLDTASNGLPAILWLGYTGAFAAALADTLASELGPLFGKKALLLKSFRPVPHGMPGAVSISGTAFGLAGAMLVGALAAALGMMRGGEIAYIVISSLIAIMSESILRAFYPGQSLLQKQVPNGILTLIGALFAILLAAALGN
jgi:uncharacterized protein (TIGR00297 family)